MTDRRSFVAWLGALSLERRSALSPARSVVIEATPTALYQPPDGRNNLVRIAVTGLDSPAARARATCPARATPPLDAVLDRVEPRRGRRRGASQESRRGAGPPARAPHLPLDRRVLAPGDFIRGDARVREGRGPGARAARAQTRIVGPVRRAPDGRPRP